MSTRLAALATVSAIMFMLINPVPAWAHIAGSGGSPSNYQATVTGIQPAAPTVGVTVGVGGQWVRVANQGAAEIVIVGYRGEPFLRLSGNRVEVNQLSSTAAETGQIPGAPALADPSAEARWVQLRDGDSATWTDNRIDPEPQGDQEASGSWELPLLVDGRQVTVLGTWERVPPPSPWPWLVALGLLAAAIASIGWRRDWHRPMAAVIAGGILAFVLHLLGTGFAPQQGGPVFGWIGVGAVGAFSMLIGAVALISTLRGSESAPDRVITVGIMVLLLAATDISVLWNSQLPFAGPAVLDRALTAITYATALGLLVAGGRLVRQRSLARRSQGE
ncbi:MAG TPA: hypothetical protein VNA67_05370 [Pseudonocardiaceae bacterium]|nr:hypothetical protein [Pseudonocardiaceae bacterium]